MKKKLQTYVVVVQRSTYTEKEYVVEANSRENAKEEAMDLAYDDVFDEDVAEYKIISAQKE